MGDTSSGAAASVVLIASHTANGWEPGGPWNTQANVLMQLTNARHELATAGLLANLHTKQGDLADQLARQSVSANEQLEMLQRSVAQPRPYRFVIEPTAKK